MFIRNNKLEQKRHKRDVNAVMCRIILEAGKSEQIKNGVIKEGDLKRGWPTHWL